MLTGRRIILIVAIIVLTGLACILLLSKAGKVGVDIANSRRVEDLCGQLAQQDVALYVVGEVPQGLSGLGEKLHEVPVDQVSTLTMPVWVSDIHSTMTDRSGAVLRENIPRDYASHMLVMVNVPESTPLTPEALEVIRNCAVDNEVPVLLVGEYSINTFREYLLAPSKVCGDNDTMLFVSPSSWTLNPFDSDGGTDGVRFTAAFIDYWFTRIAADGN